MKAEINVYLSLLAFVQVLLISAGAGLFKEVTNPTSTGLTILLFSIFLFVASVVVGVLYFALFMAVSTRKK
jgi:hypothetical protein